MNNPKLKKEKTVALPSILLWAAGKKSHSTGNQQDLALVLELFKKSVTFRKKEEWSAAGAETSFLSIAKKNLGKGVIPFEYSLICPSGNIILIILSNFTQVTNLPLKIKA
jgi:hypothetical protein